MKTEIDENELTELRNDKARLDWLADANNTLGGVQLPMQCVENNIHCMRAAIDAAMMIEVVE